jgi:ADP-ribosylglycohydrolase
VESTRARGALLGLAIGDAMGAPTEGLEIADIRRRWGRVTGFLTDDVAGTDDTEYAVLCARGVLAAGDALTADIVADTWLEALAEQRAGFAGAGFSEMIAIANLLGGIRPPRSGAWNQETWSDGAAMRVAPIGVYASGDPALAMRLAAEDARVSHSRDGVYGAQAIAAGVATAMVAESIEPVIDAMVAALPPDSWTRRLVGRALETVEATDSPRDAEGALAARIPLRHYMWADAGPEALALCIGLLRATEGAPAVIESGVNIGRDSDTIAAMAGAISGALHGEDAFPAEWRSQVRRVAGRCIAATADTDLVDLADALLVRCHEDRAREDRARG